MSRSARIDRPVLASLALLSIAAWWGCAKAAGDPMMATTGTTTTSSTSDGGGGAGGDGGDGGDGGEAGACVPTIAPTHYVPLDIVFLVDQTADMHGADWSAVLTALPGFFNDPASAGIGAGVLFFPYSAYDCDLNHYKLLTVPVGVLPGNAKALTDAFPADAVGMGKATYPALQGALMQATALQDAHPTHKVMVVLITDGDPYACDNKLEDVVGLAASALNYNGVRTHVIGVYGAPLADLSKIAAAGGTTAAHSATIDVSQVVQSLAEIRTTGLGCDFSIPTPPNNQPLDPAEVNLSYTPKGKGDPVVLLRSKDLAGCTGQPGWYFDSESAPTKIVLCPMSCATVQSDPSAVVDVLFGCKSQSN